MKTQLILFITFIGQLCFANMASPYFKGTKASEVFTSRDIDIVKEKIHVTIDKSTQTATYLVEYHVKTDLDGKQVPLLFYALDFRDNFYVSVDNKEIKTVNIPDTLKSLIATKFEPFSRYFKLSGNNSYSILKFIDNVDDKYVDFKELKYFEAKLSKGEHIFRVKYIANPSGVRANWINEYNFQYSLSPAKYWKSFGSLEVTIDAINIKSKISTNLGQPTSGRLDSIATWHFDKLPNDIFTINYTPQITWFARLLIAIDPFGLSLILTLFIAWLHFLSIKKHRKNKYTERYSWVVIWGSLINPFLILLFYMFSFDIIDTIIGSHASKFHGYTFLSMFLYPIFLAIYMTIMWKIDKEIKTKQLKRTNP